MRWNWRSEPSASMVLENKVDLKQREAALEYLHRFMADERVNLDVLLQALTILVVELSQESDR